MKEKSLIKNVLVRCPRCDWEGILERCGQDRIGNWLCPCCFTKVTFEESGFNLSKA